MPKPNVKVLKCFGEVAAVIGEKRAKLDLFKAVHYKGVDFCDGLLGQSFYWAETPQGSEFWSDIDDGVNPYDK